MGFHSSYKGCGVITGEGKEGVTRETGSPRHPPTSSPSSPAKNRLIIHSLNFSDRFMS